MNAVLNYDPTDPDKMRLPKGITCGDCFHIHRCKAMFGHVETDTYCDWSPSRFRPAAAQGKRDALNERFKDRPRGDDFGELQPRTNENDCE